MDLGTDVSVRQTATPVNPKADLSINVGVCQEATAGGYEMDQRTNTSLLDG